MYLFVDKNVVTRGLQKPILIFFLETMFSIWYTVFVVISQNVTYRYMFIQYNSIISCVTWSICLLFPSPTPSLEPVCARREDCLSSALGPPLSAVLPVVRFRPHSWLQCGPLLSLPYRAWHGAPELRSPPPGIHSVYTIIRAGVSVGQSPLPFPSLFFWLS